MQMETKNVFKVGDKAILNEDVAFTQGNGAGLIGEGTEVEIIGIYDGFNDVKLCEIKWNGATSIVNSRALKPIKQKCLSKFKPGDKVKISSLSQNGIVVDTFESMGKLGYKIYVAGINYLQHIPEDDVEEYAESIIDRIKTFDDAVEWCSENGHGGSVLEYNVCAFHLGNLSTSVDILAYLKLRIITTALNEGWEPMFEDGEERWYVGYEVDGTYVSENSYCWATAPNGLIFKSARLAEYAAVHFKDIYGDFCGSKKEINN